MRQRTVESRRFEDVSEDTGRRHIEQETDSENAGRRFLDEPEAGVDDVQVEQGVVEHEDR